MEDKYYLIQSNLKNGLFPIIVEQEEFVMTKDFETKQQQRTYLSSDKKSEKIKFAIYLLYLERPDLPPPLYLSLFQTILYMKNTMVSPEQRKSLKCQYIIAQISIEQPIIIGQLLFCTNSLTQIFKYFQAAISHKSFSKKSEKKEKIFIKAS